MTKQKVFYVPTQAGLKRLKPVSLGKRQDLADLLEYAYSCMMDENNGDSFADLYDKNKYFAKACNDAVALNGLSHESLDIDMLYALLMPHQDSEGKVHGSGILVELNFASANSKKGKGSHTTIADVIAMLWQINGDLSRTIDALFDDRIAGDVLLNSVDKYSKLTNPEAYAKSKAKSKALEHIKAQENAQFSTEEIDTDAFLSARRK